MLRLSTFGGVLLRQDGEMHVGAASQRRRLALLVLVASAGRGTISRDKLVGYLWPESDPERARHSLRQALHAVQRALNVDNLFIGTDALQLNPTLISTDLADVQDATEAGADERVVGLCKGPFLDGFNLGDSVPFEEWVEEQRRHYDRVVTAALERCAERAVSRSDFASALPWWRRLAADHPTSSRYTLRVMRALANTGDATSALRFGALHQALVRDELGAEPESAILDLIVQLREGKASERSDAAPPPRNAAADLFATSRRQTLDRQRDWLESAFGDRFVVDAGRRAAGVSVVYSAYDRLRATAVDIHIVDPSLATVADADRLITGLERLVTLVHPRIVPFYEVGSNAGVIFYVVARAKGESLREVLERDKQLPVHESLRIADDIAAALVAGHEAGVLHVDLRPRFVFTDAGETSLVGMGISDALTAAISHDQTSTALRVGSPAYQSPEQLAGDTRLDARSDLYSLGCILYQMLAGDVPFASTSRSLVASGKFAGAVAPIRDRRDTVDAELDLAVQKCLARSPSDRYRTVAEFRAVLARWLDVAQA